MTTPVVTELPRALESVTRDPFLDVTPAGSFAVTTANASSALGRRRTRSTFPRATSVAAR